MKIIYVASLGHSGSTLLDMILSKHDKVLGLGQIETTFKQNNVEDNDRPCSCGEKRKDCEVWSNIIDGEEDWVVKYNKLIDYAKKNNNEAIVDSTKNIPFLEKIRSGIESGELKAEDVSVVYILKNVKAWAYSGMKRDTDRYGKKSITPIYFLKWYIHNRKMKKDLDKMGIDYYQVSYKQLCKNTDNVVNTILSNADLDTEGFDIKNVPNTHAASGNVMRKVGKDLEIKFDESWKGNVKNITLWFTLLPFVYFWNKKNCS